jgi:hypothetical protein
VKENPDFLKKPLLVAADKELYNSVQEARSYEEERLQREG